MLATKFASEMQNSVRVVGELGREMESMSLEGWSSTDLSQLTLSPAPTEQRRGHIPGATFMSPFEVWRPAGWERRELEDNLRCERTHV